MITTRELSEPTKLSHQPPLHLHTNPSHAITCILRPSPFHLLALRAFRVHLGARYPSVFVSSREYLFQRADKFCDLELRADAHDLMKEFGHIAPLGEPWQYDVYLSYAHTDARDFAKALNTYLEEHGKRCFFDENFELDMHHLESNLEHSKKLLLVLSSNTLECERCVMELTAAVRHGIKMVIVLKEGSRWMDDHGEYSCTFPPRSYIESKVPTEVIPVFFLKAIKHESCYYSAFTENLLERLSNHLNLEATQLPTTGGTLAYDVFISYKRSDAQDFVRALYTELEKRGKRCFLDMEVNFVLNDVENNLKAIAAKSKVLVFILSDNALDSKWCAMELTAAVRHGTKVVIVLKEGSRWMDDHGKYSCTFPPRSYIESKVPKEVVPLFIEDAAIKHTNEYYSNFVETLIQEI